MNKFNESLMEKLIKDQREDALQRDSYVFVINEINQRICERQLVIKHLTKLELEKNDE